MSQQCPSVGKARTRGPRAHPAQWRSLEEWAQTPAFTEFVEREFPSGASELLGTSRRAFLQLMGASLALAGAATVPGCRRPDHKIMAYSRAAPEEQIPGRPLYYATSMPLPCGGAEGLLVETHEGRPTKIEGNPLHPINRGRSSVWSQASILGMYDPDRLKYPVYRGGGKEAAATWEDFATWCAGYMPEYDASGGEGLAFIVEKKASPSRDALRDRVRGKWPKARWIAYNAAECLSPLMGAEMAFGRPMRSTVRLDRAKVVVSLDRDFLQHEPASLVQAREFAAARRVLTTQDEMSRLYVVECGMTITGAQADHRVRCRPSAISAFGVALAREVLKRAIQPRAKVLSDALAAVDMDTSGVDQGWVRAAAQDLRDHAGESLVVAGDSQSPEIHALVYAMNAVLGNSGRTVSYMSADEESATDSAAAIADLAREMDAGRISTLVCVNVNPVYDAPAELGFGGLFSRVPTTISLSVDLNETAAAAMWQLDGAHYLESWGDTEAADGTIAPIQPMVAPLYGSRSDLELLAMLLREHAMDGYELVRAVWRQQVSDRWAPNRNVDFEAYWRRALQDGKIDRADAPAPSDAGVDFGAVAGAISAVNWQPGGGLDAVFTVDTMYDGRFANCGWLQELPRDGTRICWDNAALMSPATAERLGLMPTEDLEETYLPKVPKGRMCRVTVGGRSVEMAAWVLPGMADDTVLLPLGYGRRVAGLVGSGTGFDTYAVRDVSSRRVTTGVAAEKISGLYPISSTQNHWSLEGRTALVRGADLPAWRKFGDEVVPHAEELYGVAGKDLSFGERLGELTHTPPNESVYQNPLNQSRDDAAEGSRYSTGQQWGMSIDLSACIGCNTCTIACQAENNIPIVGKKEVRKGREMTWIRVDRYFTGDLYDPDGVLHQPVACVQCENAPCETVCPVNATTHDPEGLNQMVYNRCIGTRYCANNCPYKVRRFNFFDYATAKYRGTFIGQQAVGGGPDNVNLIPPRLREKVDQITRMQQNPDVTVRSRGVMEKCTYCVQRINHARWESKAIGHALIPEGFFKTACEQACPTGAIVFGDLLQNSRVRDLHGNPRAYMLLGYLNTRPRTRYLARISNPNPELVGQERRQSWENPFGHGGAGEHDAGDGHAALERTGAFVDPVRKMSDDGYTLSLPVLGGATGAIG